MINKNVWIIILNWNNFKATIECLKSLNKMDFLKFKVLICDNGSNDYSAQNINSWLKDYRDREGCNRLKYSCEILELSENLGFAGGNNAAIKYLLGKGKVGYFLLLNNDTIVHEKLLGNLLETINVNHKIGAVGAVNYELGAKNKIIETGINYNSDLTVENMVPNQESKYCYVDKVMGSAFLLKSEIVQKVGLFDEKYFLYYEDSDLCLRIKKCGYHVALCFSAIIYHSTVGSSNSFVRKYFETRNRLLLIRNNLPVTSKYKAMIIIITIQSKAILTHIIKKRDLLGGWSLFLGMYDGLCGKYYKGRFEKLIALGNTKTKKRI